MIYLPGSPKEAHGNQYLSPAPHSERGNALFLILIGVVLFATLSYAVTSSSKGGGTTQGKEQLLLDAAAAIDFSAEVEAAAKRIMLSTNAPVENIHFENNVAQRNDGTTINGALGSPADPTLYLFHANGGGVVARTFPKLATTCPACNSSNWKPGHFAIRWASIAGIGTATADMSLRIAYVSDAACTEFNSKLGIIGIPVVTMATTGAAPVYGAAPPALANPSGAGAATIQGKTMFCVFDTTENGNIMFNVFVVN
jgi:hypothetical protein